MHDGWEGMAWTQEQELADHVLSTYKKKRGGNSKGGEAINTKVHPQ